MNQAVVLACAVCAQRPGSGSASLLLLLFLAVPFLVAAFVIRAIRHVDS